MAGIYWHPDNHLKSKIEESLAMIGGENINWAELIANSEWLGKEFEEEINPAERNKYHFQNDDGD